MEKVKKQAKQLTESTKRVISGVEEFVIGATAGYNYYDLSIRPVGNVEYVVRLASSVIVALAGAWLLARHFNNRAK
jgi:ABC-type nickel/cobalt efflux system permease component RcnA